MTRLTVPVLLLSLGIALLKPQAQDRAVTIDGYLKEPFWNHLVPARLIPTEPGLPAEIGGELRAVMAGNYLYVGAHLAEPDGYVTGRSLGRNPNWEEGEDVLQVVLRVQSENDWMLQIGPLGAYSVKWRWTGESDWYTSDPEKCDRFLVATGIGEKEWSAEVAIPLSQLGSPRPGAVRLSAERVRAIRPGHSEERWRWPGDEPVGEVPATSPDQKLSDPLFRPIELGNKKPTIEVGRIKELPSLDSRWTDTPWRDVPVWRLYQNEPLERLPRFPTEVRLIHDGHTLAVMARCSEPTNVIAQARDRDSPMDQDDSFQVFLATSGSSYVQYAINPLGFLMDAAGKSGGPRISRPYVEWNSPVRSSVRKDRGEWVVRLDLPLDPIRKVLGETQIPPEWRILLLRHRPGREGEPQETTVLPVTESVTPICPARYGRLRLIEADPFQLKATSPKDRSTDLAFVHSRVFSSEQRKQLGLAEMLAHHTRERMLNILKVEKRDWDQVQTVSDWEKFREPRLKALATSLGGFPPRTPLQTQVTKEFLGEGYRREDIVYQSRPGLWVTANLYSPLEHRTQMPGIIIVHSLHGPKTQFELQDMGIIWARAGCAVLVMDQVGFGERLQNYPWEREAIHSRYIMGMQLYLIGESLMTWMVWDIMRGVDLLLDRKDVNEKQIILLGAVAGGGDPAAVAATLDLRVSAVVPFNFGEAMPEVPRFLPERNQWPLDLADAGWIDWESTRSLRRSIVDQFLQWTICAAVAPRRFIYSYELGWEVEKLPAWARYRRVFSFYNAADHLADAHGFGPYPGPGECWNVGPAQRKSLYPTLERWFGIPTPFAEMRVSTSHNLENAIGERRPESELSVLNPTVVRDIQMRTVYELAREVGQSKSNEARAHISGLSPQERLSWVREKWATKLGDIEPNRHPEGRMQWSKQIAEGEAEGISLDIEPGIVVPVLLLRPKKAPGGHPPVAVVVSEGGKDAVLAAHSAEVEALLNKGVAICLPDVRGTGETSPDCRRDPDGAETTQAATELMLGETLLGKRLKDVRTVIAYLQGRQDLDPKRIGIWGDSLVPVSQVRPVLDELPLWQVGPDIQHQAEPLGGLLALLGGIYNDNVKAVAVRHGLTGFLSILEDRFAYVPLDVIIPGILEVGDIADLAAALAPRALLMEDLVDGRNCFVPEDVLQRQLEPLYKAYRETAPARLSVRSGQEKSDLVQWLYTHL